MRARGASERARLEGADARTGDRAGRARESEREAREKRARHEVVCVRPSGFKEHLASLAGALLPLA